MVRSLCRKTSIYLDFHLTIHFLKNETKMQKQITIIIIINSNLHFHYSAKFCQILSVLLCWFLPFYLSLSSLPFFLFLLSFLPLLFLLFLPPLFSSFPSLFFPFFLPPFERNKKWHKHFCQVFGFISSHLRPQAPCLQEVQGPGVRKGSLGW